jgi:membrane-bound lytic murein transglycosylase B
VAAGADAGHLARDLRCGDPRLEPDLTLPDLDLPGREGAPPRGQAEFVQTPADYIKEANIARMAGQAKKLAAEHARTLAAIEQQSACRATCCSRSGGRETDFGTYKLPKNGITVLATQGYYGGARTCSAGASLRAQDAGGGPRQARGLRSSWGGAMG